VTERHALRLLLLAALLVVTARAHADVDDGWALPASVERTFQTVVHDVNDEHALGEFVTLKDVRIEGTRVRLLLVYEGKPGSAVVVLEHRRKNGDGFARFFDHRVDAGNPTGPLSDAVTKLPPVLDARFPADPWLLSSNLPRNGPVAPGGPDDGFHLRSRAVVLGGAAVVLVLMAGVLAFLVRRSDAPPAD
jgi:hypothetical protein